MEAASRPDIPTQEGESPRHLEVVTERPETPRELPEAVLTTDGAGVLVRLGCYVPPEGVASFRERVARGLTELSTLASDFAMLTTPGPIRRRLRPVPNGADQSPEEELLSDFEPVSIEVPIGYRGKPFTGRAHYRPDPLHPEHAYMVMSGLYGDATNSALVVESDQLGAVWLLERPNLYPPNSERVWQPGYSQAEHLADITLYYHAALRAAVERGAERITLDGHSLGGPLTRRLLDHLRDTDPELYDRIQAVIIANSGDGTMIDHVTLSSLPGSAQALKRGASALRKGVRAYARVNRALEGIGGRSVTKPVERAGRSAMSLGYTKRKVGHPRRLDRRVARAAYRGAARQALIPAMEDAALIPGFSRQAESAPHEIPTLYISGWQDELVSPAAAAAADRTDRIRTAHLAEPCVGTVVIPDGTHFSKAQRETAAMYRWLVEQMATRPTTFIADLNPEYQSENAEDATWHAFPVPAET